MDFLLSSGYRVIFLPAQSQPESHAVYGIIRSRALLTAAKEIEESGVPTQIYFFGDYDSSSVDIYRQVK